MVTGLHRWCPLPPPNPPPRRGEGGGDVINVFFAMFRLSLWGIFVTSFLIGLSGALMPGPIKP